MIVHNDHFLTHSDSTKPVSDLKLESQEGASSSATSGEQEEATVTGEGVRLVTDVATGAGMTTDVSRETWKVEVATMFGTTGMLSDSHVYLRRLGILEAVSPVLQTYFIFGISRPKPPLLEGRKLNSPQ